MTVGLLTCGAEQQGHTEGALGCVLERAGLAHLKPSCVVMQSFTQEAVHLGLRPR